MPTIHDTKAQAQAVLTRRKSNRKPAPHFTVNVSFGDVTDPQVVAENVKGAATAIDAARTWAFGAVTRGDAEMSDYVNVFGVRGMNEAGKIVPSDEERMLRRMLNGGGLTLRLGSVTFYGTFEGYSVPA